MLDSFCNRHHINGCVTKNSRDNDDKSSMNVIEASTLHKYSVLKYVYITIEQK